MSTTPDTFAQSFATLFRRKFPHVQGLRVTWDETETRTISKTVLPDPLPAKAPPAPVLALEPEAAPVAQPEPQRADEAQRGPVRERRLPDADVHTVGRKFSDEEVGIAKMLMVRGMTTVEISRTTGISVQHLTAIRKGRTRRAVPASPDPRGK